MCGSTGGEGGGEEEEGWGARGMVLPSFVNEHEKVSKFASKTIEKLLSTAAQRITISGEQIYREQERKLVWSCYACCMSYHAFLPSSQEQIKHLSLSCRNEGQIWDLALNNL